MAQAPLPPTRNCFLPGPPERMRDRDFDREPDEPGVCGLDGSGRAGERSGVRQLMGDGVPMLLLRELRARRLGVARSDAERKRGG